MERAESYCGSIVSEHVPSGEFKLFFAILEDALRCYVRTKNCPSGAKRAEFLDACNWFYELGSPYLFSFESVCAFLYVDPNWLRRRLEALTPTAFPRKQFRTHRRHSGRPSANQGASRPAQSTTASANGHEGSGNHPASSGVWSGQATDVMGCS